MIVKSFCNMSLTVGNEITLGQNIVLFTSCGCFKSWKSINVCCRICNRRTVSLRHAREAIFSNNACKFSKFWSGTFKFWLQSDSQMFCRSCDFNSSISIVEIFKCSAALSELNCSSKFSTTKSIASLHRIFSTPICNFWSILSTIWLLPCSHAVKGDGTDSGSEWHRLDIAVNLFHNAFRVHWKCVCNNVVCYEKSSFFTHGGWSLQLSLLLRSATNKFRSVTSITLLTRSDLMLESAVSPAILGGRGGGVVVWLFGVHFVKP